MAPTPSSPNPNMALTDFRFFLRAATEIKHPTYDVESQLINSGLINIAGLDEAGRGPLAGPVTAAAVILDPNNIPHGLNDSKQLTEAARNDFLAEILKRALVSVVSLNAETIDQMNIRATSLLAMRMALEGLPIAADVALIDGNAVPEKLKIPAFAMIKGDARSLSIAAASIVAKTVRDQIMIEADKSYPDYGFAKNKGYPTRDHRDVVARLGPCPLHRKSFKPVADALIKINIS